MDFPRTRDTKAPKPLTRVSEWRGPGPVGAESTQDSPWEQLQVASHPFFSRDPQAGMHKEQGSTEPRVTLLSSGGSEMYQPFQPQLQEDSYVSFGLLDLWGAALPGFYPLCSG